VRDFRFIAGAISHEDTHSYERLLSRLKDVLEEKFQFKWNPSWSVLDAADSIINAVHKVFPNIQHYRCYFHIVKALKDKILRWKISEEKSILKENTGIILYFLSLLHQTKTDDDFFNLWKLIKKEWEQKTISKSFIDYFAKNYVNNRKKQCWNRVSQIGHSLTNNSLERFHLNIKETYTDRKKLAINEFLFKCVKMIRDCSLGHQILSRNH